MAKKNKVKAIEFVDKSKPKRFTIVCGPFDLEHVTDGTPCICKQCGAKLWISDSSLLAVAEKDPDITMENLRVLCVPCGQEVVRKENIQKANLTAQQLEELERFMKEKPKTQNGEL